MPKESIIKHFSSSTTGNVPSSGDLIEGELAINTADEKVFFKNLAGNVVSLGASKDISGSYAAKALPNTFTAVQSFSSGLTASNGITFTGGIHVVNGDTFYQTSLNIAGTYFSLFRKSRGTATSPTVVQQNDDMGGFLWGGWDGSAWAYRSGIISNVDGPVSAGNVPTALRFYAGKTAGPNSSTLRMIISSTGDVGIGTLTPTERLTVSGNASVSGWGSFAGGVSASGATFGSISAPNLVSSFNSLTGDVTLTAGTNITVTNPSPGVIRISNPYVAPDPPTVGNGTLTLTTSGTGLTGYVIFTANQSGNSTFTVTSNATNANTASTIVSRDGSGNFSAGTITASLNGNASTATSAATLTTARSINGTSFNGGSNITINQMYREDNRTISPSEVSAGYSRFAFTSWNNNNTSPYADSIHFRTYTDSSGGNDNLLMLNKSSIGMRLWQQSYGSASAYSNYKDVAFIQDTVSSFNGTTGAVSYAPPLATVSATGVASFSSTNFDVSSGAVSIKAGGVPNTATTATSNNTANAIVSRDGSGNFSAGTITASLNGNASTATSAATLTTARSINGTSFNGGADITTANWGTSRTITVGDTGKSVNGSGNVAWTAVEIGATSANTANKIVMRDANGDFNGRYINASYFNHSHSAAYRGSDTQFYSSTDNYIRKNTKEGFLASLGLTNTASANTAGAIVVRDGSGNFSAGTITASLAGNASTATSAATLTTARSINGTSFNGGADITTANWGTSRTITVGDTGKSVNGSGNVSWSFSEIGAVSTNTANKIVLRDGSGNFSAGTITAALNGNASTATSAATLTTARSINGTSFNGGSDITTANWGTSRTITVGDTGKSVNGSGNVSWSFSEIGAVSTNTANKIVLRDGSGNFSAGTATLGALTVDTNTLHVDAANNRVGIGTTTPSRTLHVAGNVELSSNPSIYFNSSVNIPTLAKNEDIRFDVYPLGGLNSASPSPFWRGLHLAPPSISSGGSSIFPRTSFYYSYTSATNPTDLAFRIQAGNWAGKQDILITPGEDATSVIGFNNNSNARVLTIGNNLITAEAGISGIGATFSGHISAATKSFVIPHPTVQGMTLRHGSLEGPENGVYVRGRAHGHTITLPHYWTGLVDEETITVQLTPFGKPQNLWVESVSIGSIGVSGCDDPSYFYTVYGERKDVARLKVEE